MNDSGWIKLHRKLLDSPLWKDCTGNQKAVLITILLLANHEPNKWIFNGTEYNVDAGQFITSLKSIAEESGTTINVVRKALMKFKKYDFSTYSSTNKNRLITIENWEKYQSKDDERTSNSTSGEQAENKQRTTNKNDKNDKNVRNINIRQKIDEKLSHHSELFRESFNGFVEMRIKINKPIKTERALSLIFNKLNELSESENEQIKILDQSTLSCWQGIYPLKQSEAKGSSFTDYTQRKHDYSDLEKRVYGFTSEEGK